MNNMTHEPSTKGMHLPGLKGVHMLIGIAVQGDADESLGEIKELMVDMGTGRIAYAVLSFGGFMGVGNKLFAVPWPALSLDSARHRFVLHLKRAQMTHAPGFDKHHWPDMTDPGWVSRMGAFYRTSTTRGDMFK